MISDASNTINDSSVCNHIEYSILSLSESKKYYHFNKASSIPKNTEYIDKLKNTIQCRRMWINDEHQNSIIATFSRGRLANQLSSFALQYAISKVIVVGNVLKDTLNPGKKIYNFSYEYMFVDMIYSK